MLPWSGEHRALVQEASCHHVLGLGDVPFWAVSTAQGPHSILMVHFFSWWQFLGCENPLHKVSVLRQWQSTWEGKGTRIVHQNLFLFYNVALCVALYMFETLPLHFASTEQLLIFFFPTVTTDFVGRTMFVINSHQAEQTHQSTCQETLSGFIV